jgi:hypothetical protein
MAQTLKDKAEQTGHKIAEKATEVGHKVGEKVEEAKDWVKEKAHQVGNRIEEGTQKAEHKAKEMFGESGANTGSVAGIRDHMDVFASCGTKVGRVDRVEGSRIKLTKNDSPDGMHHIIPTSWVAQVDDHVHLNVDHKEVQSQWQPA